MRYQSTICPTCGETFTKPESSRKRCCSRDCANKARAVPRVAPCAICGTPFDRNVAHRRYCSDKCSKTAWHRGNVEPTAQRFWSKVNKTDSCWFWTARTNENGYGLFSVTVDGETVSWYAHRFAWHLTNGAIPEGLWVLHNCPGGDNPSCVNPAHCYLGTLHDNVADAVAKGQLPCGESKVLARLTDADVITIRRDYDAGRRIREMARHYGVSPSTISEVARRLRWRHLP